MEARPGACQLDIVLYSEVMASKAVAVLYPLNVLRNAALLVARTELLFILDGDMLISKDLSTALADPARCAACLIQSSLCVSLAHQGKATDSKDAGAGPG